MKKSLLYKFLIFGVFIAWTVRYITLNQGNVLSYPYHMRSTENYNIGDNIEFGNNSVLYCHDNLNGFIMSVNSSQIIDFNEFCSEYQKNINDFINPSERYLKINVTISNLSGSDTEFPFLPLIVKGVDWWCQYSYEETDFANKGVQFNSSYGQITGIDIQNGKTVNINLVYSLFRDMFTSARWDNFDNESIYLILTSVPIEQKVKL